MEFHGIIGFYIEVSFDLSYGRYAWDFRTQKHQVKRLELEIWILKLGDRGVTEAIFEF